MAQGTRICKVCGKEYPYCKTERRIDLYRWQDVGCSPEHAAIYFAEIAASRGETKKAEEEKSVEEKAPAKEEQQEREPKRQKKVSKEG